MSSVLYLSISHALYLLQENTSTVSILEHVWRFVETKRIQVENMSTLLNKKCRSHHGRNKKHPSIQISLRFREDSSPDSSCWHQDFSSFRRKICFFVNCWFPKKLNFWRPNFGAGKMMSWFSSGCSGFGCQ